MLGLYLWYTSLSLVCLEFRQHSSKDLNYFSLMHTDWRHLFFGCIIILKNDLAPKICLHELIILDKMPDFAE